MAFASHSDFRFQDHPSILVASRIIIEPGSTVRRVVLRELSGKQYVTHMENVVLEDGVWKHASFDNGNYFKDQNEAFRDFMERSKRL